MGAMKTPIRSQNPGVVQRVAAAGGLPMPETRALAGVIRRRREQLQLSHNQLAARAGVSRQEIDHLEGDASNPTADILARVAAALEVTFGELCMGATGSLGLQPAGCRACQYVCIP